MQSAREVAETILGQLAALGARLSVEGDRLRCHLSGGSLPPDLSEQIRAHKPQLLAYIRGAARPLLPPFQSGVSSAEGELSCAQTRIWLHEQKLPGSLFYEIPLAIRIRGQVNSNVMREAWRALCLKHGSLRTNLVSAEVGLPRQIITNRFEPLQLKDWTARGLATTEALTSALQAEAKQIASQRTSLAIARLCHIRPDESVLLLAIHHIVTDGWSLSTTAAELIESYKTILVNKHACSNPPTASYLDYVQWQIEYLSSAAFQEDLRYWTVSLAGAVHQIDPPWTSDPTGLPASGERITVQPESSVHPEMKRWARAQGGSVYSLLFSCWGALLHIWSAQDDFIIGTVVGGRPHPALENVLGCFMNTLPIRCKIDGGQSFADLHCSVNEAILAAYEHQHCPTEHIVSAVNPERGTRNPLFNTAVLLQNFPQPDPTGSELAFELLEIPLGGLSLDLRLIGWYRNGSFMLTLEFNKALLSKAGATQLISNYVSLLQAVLENSGTLIDSLRDSLRWGRDLVVRRRCTIVSSFTSEPVADAFDFWRDTQQLPLVLQFAPYAQVVQQLLDANSVLRRHSDYGCLLLRLEDWLAEGDSDCNQLRSQVEQLIDACRAYAAEPAPPLVLCICPSLLPHDAATAQSVDDAEEAVCSALASLPLRVVSRKRFFELFELGDDGIEGTQQTGHVPYQPKAYTAIGTMVARQLAAVVRNPIKVVALDADNTLWRGVCAEDGSEGIDFDEPARALHRFFRSMRDQGVALCLCSKNAEVDVKSVLEHHPDSLLRWTDFSAHRVNWKPKSTNIVSIAAELNVALDSIVFVDDNPAEIAEVEANCPEVLCVALPEDRREIAALLRAVWEFDVSDLSGEAKRRLETYSLNRTREELRSTTSSIEEYLLALQVRVSLRLMLAADIERVAELMQRTNQFNFSGVRLSAHELMRWSRRRNHGVLVIEVTDRYGNYGLTGVLLYRHQGNAMLIENFLLSCRVLGKGAEDQVLTQLRQVAVAAGAAELRFELVRSERNEPAVQFAKQRLRAHVAKGEERQSIPLNLSPVQMAAQL